MLYVLLDVTRLRDEPRGHLTPFSFYDLAPLVTPFTRSLGMPSALFQAVFPVFRLAAHVHHRVDHYAITLDAIINAEWEPLDKIAPHIFFDDLPSLRIDTDFFDAGLEGVDKRLGQSRADVSIIGNGGQILFERRRMKGVPHLSMILYASSEAS